MATFHRVLKVELKLYPPLMVIYVMQSQSVIHFVFVKNMESLIESLSCCNIINNCIICVDLKMVFFLFAQQRRYTQFSVHVGQQILREALGRMELATKIWFKTWWSQHSSCTVCGHENYTSTSVHEVGFHEAIRYSITTWPVSSTSFWYYLVCQLKKSRLESLMVYRLSSSSKMNILLRPS